MNIRKPSAIIFDLHELFCTQSHDHHHLYIIIVDGVLQTPNCMIFQTLSGGLVLFRRVTYRRRVGHSVMMAGFHLTRPVETIGWIGLIAPHRLLVRGDWRGRTEWVGHGPRDTSSHKSPPTNGVLSPPSRSVNNCKDSTMSPCVVINVST